MYNFGSYVCILQKKQRLCSIIIFFAQKCVFFCKNSNGSKIATFQSYRNLCSRSRQTRLIDQPRLECNSCFLAFLLQLECNAGSQQRCIYNKYWQIKNKHLKSLALFLGCQASIVINLTSPAYSLGFYRTYTCQRIFIMDSAPKVTCSCSPNGTETEETL